MVRYTHRKGMALSSLALALGALGAYAALNPVNLSGAPRQSMSLTDNALRLVLSSIDNPQGQAAWWAVAGLIAILILGPLLLGRTK